MRALTSKLGLIGFLLCLGFSFSASAETSSARLTLDDKLMVLSLSRSITHVHPHLTMEKRVRYALTIVKAAKTYDVDPVLLAAIAHQESSFTEDLGRGPAGEYGIAQICERWLTKPHFVEKFGKKKTGGS